MYEFAWPSPAFGGLLGSCPARAIPFGPTPPQTLAATVHAAWVAFARCGDPGWPRYEPSRRATMRFGTPSQVVDDPRAMERALWEGVR